MKLFVLCFYFYRSANIVKCIANAQRDERHFYHELLLILLIFLIMHFYNLMELIVPFYAYLRIFIYIQMTSVKYKFAIQIKNVKIRVSNFIRITLPKNTDHFLRDLSKTAPTSGCSHFRHQPSPSFIVPAALLAQHTHTPSHRKITRIYGC